MVPFSRREGRGSAPQSMVSSLAPGPWGRGRWRGSHIPGLSGAGQPVPAPAGGHLFSNLDLGNLPGLIPNLAWLLTPPPPPHTWYSHLRPCNVYHFRCHSVGQSRLGLDKPWPADLWDGSPIARVQGQPHCPGSSSAAEEPGGGSLPAPPHPDSHNLGASALGLGPLRPLSALDGPCRLHAQGVTYGLCSLSTCFPGKWGGVG